MAMYQTVDRKMTEDERRRLLACVPFEPSPFRSRPFKLKLVGESLGLVVAIVVLVGVQKQPPVFVIPFALGLYALWWLLNLNGRILKPLRKSRDGNERVRLLHNSITVAQTVRVDCVEADGVVQVTYDEGTICLCDIGQNQTYWVDPYSMFPGRAPKDWPNRKFEVVDVPGFKMEFGPFCIGKPLRPRETVEFRDLFEHNDFVPPADGLIHQSIDAFLAEAKRRNQNAAEATK